MESIEEFMKKPLVVKDEQLDSDLWEKEDNNQKKFNLSLADALVEVAPFLRNAVKKIARHNKEVFGVTLLSAVSESIDSEVVVQGSVLHQAVVLLKIEEPRAQNKLLSWLKDFISADESAWVQPLSELPDEEIEWLIPDWIQRGVVHQFQGEMDKG